jgi:methanogenic corrinoid protein MtbC1
MSQQGSLEGVASAVNDRLDVAGSLVKDSVDLGAQVPADVVAEIAAVANRASVVVDATAAGASETVGDVVDKLVSYAKEITELIAKLPRLITG